SILGDVVRQVAGDAVDLTVLMAAGQDPHTYQASAQDLARIAEAHVIFVNGFGFEEGLLDDLANAASQKAPIVAASTGIEPLEDNADEHEDEHEGDIEAEAAGHEKDPHVWFDVRNVERWTRTIEHGLSTLDPANAETYHANADAYARQLEELDHAIREAVAEIPQERRRLIASHDTFRYFARAYGFDVIGAVIPSVTTGAEPSAADLSHLIEVVEENDVPAIFVENTVNDQLAAVVSEETGVPIYQLYTDALGPPGSEADSYIKLMRANVATLAKALARE
ncbi:MAG: metal ABC transporter substrate-binding protein, partial [Ardenticatenaceae bacterium]